MPRHRIAGLLLIPVVILFDQITKIMVVDRIETGSIRVLPFFDLVLVWNRGISFGLFNGAAGPLILIFFSLAIAAFLAGWLWRTQKPYLSLALGAVIGGALGNVIDRLRLGAVVDFLDFHLGSWHWPAFNIADSAIVLGIAFIVIDGLFFDAEEKKS